MRIFFHLLEHMSLGDIFALPPRYGQTQTRMGCLRKSPEVEFDSYRWLSHLGVRAPYAARRKRRYEANQVWMNTTFISQGPQSWGKLAVET
jgi:hypothetical protein